MKYYINRNNGTVYRLNTKTQMYNFASFYSLNKWYP